MLTSVREYFADLSTQFGAGWNRFWLTPSDPRTLCALRWCAGLMALYLHLTLSFDLENFFAADGLLPPAVVERWSVEFADGGIRALPPLNQLSYLNYTTTPGELWTAHLIGLAVLVLFTIGFQTRIMSIAALYVGDVAEKGAR